MKNSFSDLDSCHKYMLGVMNRAALLLILIPSTAYGEVMDKELSLHFLVLWAVISATVSFAAARCLPPLLLPVLPVSALFFYGQLSEVTDPFIGSAILREAGSLYIIISCGAPFLTVTAIVTGFWLRKRHAAGQSDTLPPEQ